jgi:prepilin-type N-terminal cleavage/methylation domain-containing protein
MTDENHNLRLLSFLKEKKAVQYESHKLQNQNGVSLVELIAVISIIVIIATLALMNTGSSKQQLNRQNAAQELKSAFERARFDSVKRRATTGEQAKVTIDTNSFTLVTDANQDGDTTDSIDSQITNLAGSNISITSSLALPYTVYFNKRGEAVTSGSVSISPSFLVCNPSCTINPDGSSDANAGNANLVLVTPTGTVNLLPGGSAIPTFSAPSGITNVSGTNQIKSGVIINGN